MNFHKEVKTAIGKVEGDAIVHPQPNLADSALEIQQLLQLLDCSYPTDIPDETQAEIQEAVTEINKDPVLRERVMGALKQGGLEALKELADNPYVNILVAACQGWSHPKS